MFSQLTNLKYHWLVGGILLLALVLRVPGLFWGYLNFDFFQPDEYQHFSIARNLINQFDNKLVPDQEVTDQFNSRGFGTQEALLGYPIIKIFHLPDYYLLMVGRLISLAYALALLILLIVIGRRIFGDSRIGLLAGLLLAVFDLNVTYSHYGVPDIPHVFWFCFSAYWIFLLAGRLSDNPSPPPLKELFWSVVGVAFSLSFRFQTVPLITLLAVLGWGLWAVDRFQRKERLMWALVAILMVVGVFYISVGFDYNWHEFLKSKKELAEGALDIIQNGKHTHWLYNPFLYLMAVIAGTSLPVAALGVGGLVYLWRRWNPGDLICRFTTFMGAMLLAAFIFLWVGDGTFVRHANIFLPALAMLGAYGGVKFYDQTYFNPKIKPLILGGVVFYTLGLTIFSQYYFVRDNRYEAARFIKEHWPGGRAAYSSYAKIKGMESVGQLPDLNNADVVVMHEALYGRYYKSFTVPFVRFPKCCQDTFLCLPQECSVIQSILKNETNYKLVREYPIENPFPERILFKNFFGTYETFLGDVRIYERI